ncbi:MAG: hypothetical protein PWQ59_1402 [Thermoanaerobacterium sp.]|jgi:hypothetical protein|nr:MAG: hypothetical protein XD67_0345 [Thermodesulfobacterium commune]MBZ4681884.1 hypothetical protein [Thermodesulfobacterium sp.]MDI3477877.1 hypothetical protein [Thermoanaerobacterium sp.]MDK2793802.1 hypothetical protein [Caldanaerobacter sp.]MDK2861268.1 hypothetical protein [Thermodesulfobacterium sp.]
MNKKKPLKGLEEIKRQLQTHKKEIEQIQGQNYWYLWLIC